MEIKEQSQAPLTARPAAAMTRRFTAVTHEPCIRVCFSELKSFSLLTFWIWGCGTGALLGEIARRCPHARLSGLDLFSDAEDRGQSARRQGDLIQGDSEALPYADHAFDLIVCCDSFHHYPNPKAVVSQLYRCLKPGGLLLIGDTTMPPLLRQIMNFAIRFSQEGDVRLYSQRDAGIVVGSFPGCAMAGFPRPVIFCRESCGNEAQFLTANLSAGMDSS